jgi:3-deoxy-D-manno-octulosonic-acid transferase
LSAFLYNLSIYLYHLIIWIVSPFNKKAKLWIKGRGLGIRDWGLGEKTSQSLIPNSPIPNPQIAWFHCASLGEFEQGRPVIEKYKETFPDNKIVLTFFSPSGYEVRKNYEGADFICYLPSDTPSNAKDFIEKINPSIAFFVKYEFWYNYLRILHEKQIPVISFSAIFRADQMFFKWNGGFYRNILRCFNHIFVQNQLSIELLQSVGIENVTVGGDTRFDRVKQIAEARKSLPIIEQFKDGKPLLIIGSCWQEDFAVIAPFLNNFAKDLKVIIAPHEIHESEIESWRKEFKGDSIRYSEIEAPRSVGRPAPEGGVFESENVVEAPPSGAGRPTLRGASILFIDNIGMLSSLYQYADFAWIGGAYGKGLHNILEAATFGLPIFFGNKNYQKFQEAVDLERLTGAKAISNTLEFANEFQKLYHDLTLRKQKSDIIKKYVEENTGGTEKIITYVQGLGIGD